MTALQTLIEAVEAGTLQNRDWSWGASSDDLSRGHVSDAYCGSVDAALALMEVVLPGWGWSVNQNVWHGHFFAHVNNVDGDEIIHDFGANASTPARALLLAILKAMEVTNTAAQEGKE